MPLMCSVKMSGVKYVLNANVLAIKKFSQAVFLWMRDNESSTLTFDSLCAELLEGKKGWVIQLL